MLVLILGIYSLSLYEFRKMFMLKENILFFIVLFAGQLFIIVNYLEISKNTAHETFPILIISILTTIILYYMLFRATSIMEIGIMLFAGTWIAGSLSLYMELGWMENSAAYQPRLMIIVLSLIWINDIGAYFFGSLLGKKLLAPAISPGKTWEGFISGLLINGIAGYVVFRITGEYSALFWIILGIVISLGATAGDLFESKLKREARVKDSGNLIPGHGGILDRFDSLLFSAPLFYLILLIWDKL
jgi:phosphatidate cytidylyltransferase